MNVTIQIQEVEITGVWVADMTVDGKKYPQVCASGSHMLLTSLGYALSAIHAGLADGIVDGPKAA